MPEIKPHLKGLYRTIQREKFRGKFLRLDMNENVEGLPRDFIANILKTCDPQFIATYPEYDSLVEKIGGTVSWLAPTPTGLRTAPHGTALALSRRLKEAFDPHGMLPDVL